MYRNSRHNKILELIDNAQIETQEELAAALIAEGYKVTQATVSRDIKELGLVKISAGTGRQFYTKEMSGRLANGKINDIARSVIINAELSEKLIVIKTMEGFGKVTKYAIEHIAENLGCVADDDTVFAVFNSNDAANLFYKKLNELIY